MHLSLTPTPSFTAVSPAFESRQEVLIILMDLLILLMDLLKLLSRAAVAAFEAGPVSEAEEATFVGEAATIHSMGKTIPY